MKVKQIIFNSVAILAFLSVAGLMFNYLSNANFSNPFLANTVNVEEEV